MAPGDDEAGVIPTQPAAPPTATAPDDDRVGALRPSRSPPPAPHPATLRAQTLRHRYLPPPHLTTTRSERRLPNWLRRPSPYPARDKTPTPRHTRLPLSISALIPRAPTPPSAWPTARPTPKGGPSATSRTPPRATSATPALAILGRRFRATRSPPSTGGAVTPGAVAVAEPSAPATDRQGPPDNSADLAGSPSPLRAAASIGLGSDPVDTPLAPVSRETAAARFTRGGTAPRPRRKSSRNLHDLWMTTPGNSSSRGNSSTEACG